MDTGSYLGVISKRMPFVIDNPAHGRAVEPLPIAGELKKAFPKATVVELYQGGDASAFGVPVYDGARDTYFGDGRDANFGGSCTNRGTGLSYGRDLRYELHLGGESRRGFIRYDLSMLGGDVKVARAMLMLNVSQLQKRPDLDFRLVALKKRWSEIEAGVMGGVNPTNVPAPSNRGRPLYSIGTVENWTEPLYASAEDRVTEPVAELTVEQTGWIGIDVTVAVRKWVAGQWPNFGLAIEPVTDRKEYGKVDVVIHASDYPVAPALRPRLVLALEGDIKPVAARIAESGPGLTAALATAKETGKPVLLNVLSAGSLTSRNFQRLLARQDVTEFVDKRFVPACIDADRPEHAELLKTYRVRRFPTSVIIWPDGQSRNVEPLAWNVLDGEVYGAFEFEHAYSGALAEALRIGPTGCK